LSNSLLSIILFRTFEFMRTFVFAFCVLFILGCKKDGIEFTIEGTVTDKSFNSFQTGGTLKLYKVAAGGGDNTLVKSVSPDSYGKYSLTFERDKSEKYIINFSRDGYFDESKTVFFSELSTNEPFKLDFITEAVSKINWLVKNVTPFSENDQVTIQKLSGRTDCPTCCVNTSYEYSGANVDDTLSCTTNANTYVRFYIVNLSQVVILDSVYCPAFGEVNYQVNF